MTKPWAFHSRSLPSLWEAMELVMKINKIIDLNNGLKAKRNRFCLWDVEKVSQRRSGELTGHEDFALVPRMVQVHSKHSVNMYNVRMDGWMNGFKWFQGFLGFCGEEKSELSIPGRRAWSRIQEGNGTPCTQSPSAGLTRPSSGMWSKLTSLSLTGHHLSRKELPLPRTPRPCGSR